MKKVRLREMAHPVTEVESGRVRAQGCCTLAPALCLPGREFEGQGFIPVDQSET
jgi:hypothetical protein